MKLLTILILLWLLLWSCGKDKEVEVNQPEKASTEVVENDTEEKPDLNIYDKNGNIIWWPAPEIVERDLDEDHEIVAWDRVDLKMIWKIKWSDDIVVQETATFEAWKNQILPWLDKAVIWMKKTGKKTITLEPADAYGEYDENMQKEVSLDSLWESAKDAKAWEKLNTSFWVVKIKTIEDEKVIIDTNPQLAWKTIIFDIEVISIR